MLKSVVVVPVARYEDLSFDQMVQQNFTFISSQVRFIKRFVAHGYVEVEHLLGNQSATTGAGKVKFVRMEKALAERVHPLTDSKASTLVKITRKHRKAFVDSNYNTYMVSAMLQTLGMNVLLFKYRILDMPTVWLFHAPKSFMLVKSFEWMKAVGLVHYVLALMDKTNVKSALKYARKKAQQENGGAHHKGKWDRSGVGLSDGLVLKSFMVLIYGIAASLVLIMLKMVLRNRMQARICSTEKYQR